MDALEEFRLRVGTEPKPPTLFLVISRRESVNQYFVTEKSSFFLCENAGWLDTQH